MVDVSGNCNSSAKPSSSYMPPEPLVLPQVIATSCGFSDEVSKGKVAIQHFGGGDDTFSPVSCITTGRCHSSSETSNGDSACSTQCSSAEGEVIEAKLKAATASKDVDMVMKVGGHQIASEEHVFCTANMCSDHSKYSDHQHHHKRNVLDCSHDNIACISCSQSAGRLSGKHGVGIERYNISCGCTSLDCCFASEKLGDGQSAWCCIRDKLNVTHSNDAGGPGKFAQESGQPITVGCKESGPSEISARNSIDGASFSKGEPSGSSEQVGSLEMKAAVYQTDELRAKGSLAMNFKLADKVAACSDKEGDSDKSAHILESLRSETSSQCQHLQMSERSDQVYEVKVCDICGDVGREYLLVSCSKCSDGAEHIYCMRVKLDKVPEGYWICEDCKLEEEKDNEERQKLEQDKETEPNAPVPSKMRITSENSDPSHNKKSLESDFKDQAVGNSRTSKTSASNFSGKRLSSSLVSTTQAGEEGVATNWTSSMLTNSFRTAVIPNNTSFKKKTTSTCRGTSLGSESLGNVNVREKFQVDSDVLKNIRSRKEKRTKMLSKSASFTCSIPRNIKNSDIRNPPSKLSDTEELKRFKHHDEPSLVGRIDTLVGPRPSDGLSGGSGNGSTSCKETQQQSERRFVSGPKLKGFSNPVAELADADLPNEAQKKLVGVTLERTCNSIEAAQATKEINSLATLPLGDLPNAMGLTSSMHGMCATLEGNYEWKGRFVIHKDGRSLGSFGGVRAHLSTRASPTVLQIVHEFPQTILLEQVACVNKWSTQTIEERTTETNVVRFSLPKDLQSCPRNYGSLSDCLAADDLCLKGDISGVELLISSSNLLQDRSQSWSKLFPFWGVLKEKTSNCSLDLLTSREGVRSDNLGLSLANSQSSNSSMHSSEILSSSNNSVTVDAESNLLRPSAATLPAPEDSTKFCPNKTNSDHKSSHSSFLDGRKGAADYLSWHQQSLGESYTSQGDRTVLKRRREINLNKESCNDDGWFAEEPECKRLESLETTFSCRGFDHANVLANDLGLGFSGNGDGSYSACERTSGRAGCLEPGILSLELSLGSTEKSAKPVAVKQLIGIVDDESDHRLGMRGCEEDGAWLSLSLSLPEPGKEQLEQVATLQGHQEQLERVPTLQGHRTVDTSLSLSCGIGN